MGFSRHPGQTASVLFAAGHAESVSKNDAAGRYSDDTMLWFPDNDPGRRW